MRLLRLEVERFGALVEREFDLDGRAFVLEGPNEAGKSSFHAAVETIFYGFQPATRDAHPYATWGDARVTLRLVALVELANGERLQVERRLAGSAGVRIAPEGAPLAGPFEGNTPLAALQAIPRPLFRAVYSLTANEVSEPDDAGIQELVDELLLGDSGLAGMRSIRSVRTELAEERAKLWRRDNRGESRERQLSKQLLEVRKELRQASEAARDAAIVEEQLDALRRQLVERRAALNALDRELEDAEILAELEGLERQESALAGADLSGFDAAPANSGQPADPSAAPSVTLEDPTLVARAVAHAREALEGPRARLARERVSTDAGVASLLARALAIEHLKVEEVEARGERRDLEQAAAARESALARARDLAAGVAPALAGALTSVPLEALRAAVLAWRDVLDEHRGALVQSQRFGWPTAAAFAIGLALAGLALSGAAAPWVGALGLGLALAAAALSALRQRPALRRLASASQPPPALVALARDAGLVDAVLARPEAALDAIGNLDEAREALRDAEGLDARAARCAAQLARRHATWVQHARAVGFDAELVASLPPEALPNALRDALASARAAHAAALRDDEERALAERELRAAERVHGREVERERRLHAALRRAEPDIADPAIAFAALQALSRERAALEGERRALAKRPRYAELLRDPRRASAHAPESPKETEESEDTEAAPCFWDAEVQSARRARRDALRMELEDAQTLAAQLTERLRLRPASEAAELGARELELNAALCETRRTHDRLALLERALVLGERRFRAEHQPDVLRAASAYLARITEGRYPRIDYPDPEQRTLMVQSRELDTHVPVGPPLSRGVREQVHLCLRLGTLEHLDRGREPLPLILDEALVHWDPARRAALYPTLRALTDRRQVILLTCQPEHALEAARQVQARHVHLVDAGPRAGRGGDGGAPDSEPEPESELESGPEAEAASTPERDTDAR